MPLMRRLRNYAAKSLFLARNYAARARDGFLGRIGEDILPWSIAGVGVVFLAMLLCDL